MRTRYTRSLGLPVLDEETGDVLGIVSGMVVHPDTGAVEGFFVRPEEFWSQDELFLTSLEILHWGVRITVRSRDVLAAPDELVRMQTILASGRPVLGQTIVTENGRRLGRCADVQFNTESFRLEWLFPRRFFRWGIPIPASSIVEVQQDAIIVRDPPVTQAEEAVSGAVREPLLPPVPEAA